MNNQCLDSYTTTFGDCGDMRAYHEELSRNSLWQHCRVNDLCVMPLDRTSPLYESPDDFAEGTSATAIMDTADNLGLAIRVDGSLYPVRTTAYKSLLDRAKISGSALAKLKRPVLAEVLNECLGIFSEEALVLVRDEKVSAVHSGDESDYAVLPIDELLSSLQKKLDEKFPGNIFERGYTDHAVTSASWKMPGQKKELLETYADLLRAQGKAKIADKLMPGIRFTTSDTGVASAKVAALLMGMQVPIPIGGCISVEHRHKKKVDDFDAALDQLFAQFTTSVETLRGLLDIQLAYPVNAMTRICKSLHLPKKAALEAISMFEMSYGGGPATAHDVFLALQEIPFELKSEGASETRLLALEETMARILTLRWNDYDLAKAVDY